LGPLFLFLGGGPLPGNLRYAETGTPPRDGVGPPPMPDLWGVGPPRMATTCTSYAKITWEIVRFYLTDI